MTAEPICQLAMKIVNRWAWYQAALKDPSRIGKTLLVHEGDPQQGYYRTKNRNKLFEPVAIYYPEGSDTIVAYRNGQEVRPDEIWTFCCRHPVTYEAYMDALAGKGWADEDPVVTAQAQRSDPQIGDNSGDVDEAEALKDQIEAALAGLTAYKKIADDETASKALAMRNRLNELAKDADKIRVKEKEPHLEAGKAVDAKWQPLVKKAKAGADQVRDAVGAWETEKYRLQREAERKAEEERLAAERAARDQTGETVTDTPSAPPPSAPPTEPVGQIRTTYGKAASVSVKTVVDQVTDWAALAVYMSGHHELQDLLRRLAQRAIDAGRMNVPGITTKEQAQVR